MNLDPTFGQRLHRSMRELGPFCAGLDPHAPLLLQWGLSDDIDGLQRFTAIAVEAFAGSVAAVKPQSAFFERFGAAGVGVLQEAIRDLRSAGTIVLLDVKRGDIGSTAQAYADAYLDAGAPMAVDAITVSPYLGLESLTPFLDTAAANDAGVFVLARTSNPGAERFQHATVGRGAVSVADDVLALLSRHNAGAVPLGSFGAVVGANIDDVDEDFGFNGPILAPGFGAQGGTLDDLRRIFGDSIRNVLTTSSRELLAEGPDVAALRAAARRTSESVGALLDGS